MDWLFAFIISLFSIRPPVGVPAVSPAQLPENVVLPSGSHTFQTFNNCGPASLSMALSYYGITVSQQELGVSLRPFQNSQGNNDDKSVTLAELAAKAKDLGFTVYHRPAGSMELLEQLLAAGVPVITRTLLTANEDIGHYRVIKGYDAVHNTILQDDSLQGKDLRFSYDEFLALWKPFNYEFLVLAKTDTEISALIDSEISAWQDALELASGTTPADGFNRSVALFHLGDYAGSIREYEAVADSLPFRTLWYQSEPILAYYHQGEHDTVLRLTALILSNENRAFSELYQLRGNIYQQRGDSVQAEAEFAKAARYNTANYWRVNL